MKTNRTWNEGHCSALMVHDYREESWDHLLLLPLPLFALTTVTFSSFSSSNFPMSHLLTGTLPGISFHHNRPPMIATKLNPHVQYDLTGYYQKGVVLYVGT